jgi:hypothetical protein
MLCNRVPELRLPPDQLTVDRDDHVVGFDTGSVGRLAGAHKANVRVATLDTRLHVIQKRPQEVGCLIDVSFLRAGEGRDDTLSKRTSLAGDGLKK